MPYQQREICMGVGLPYHHLTMDQALADCMEAISQRDPVYIATANVDFTCQAYQDAALRDLIFNAHRILCDGWPLVWQSKKLGTPLPERVAGSDLMPLLIKQCAQNDHSVYFFGSDNETLAEAKSILENKHPGLKICGFESPKIGLIHEWDNVAFCERINVANPDVLLIALGCPKQERWYRVNQHRLKVPLALGIGASLDFISGKQIRAPRWVQALGMEWFWRMTTDPKRLVSRYTKNIQFFHNVARKERQIAGRQGKDALRKPLSDEDLSGARSRLSILSLNDISSNLPVDGHAIVDCSQAKTFNYKEFGILADISRQARLKNKLLILYSPPQSLQTIIAHTRLQRQFPICDSAVGVCDAVNRHDQQELGVSDTGLTPTFALTWKTFSRVETWYHDHADQGFTLSLGQVPFVDSNALVRLMELQQYAQGKGHQLVVKDVDTDTQQLIIRLKIPLTEEAASGK